MNSRSRPLQNPSVRDFNKPEPTTSEPVPENDYLIPDNQLDFFDLSSLPVANAKQPNQLQLRFSSRVDQLKRIVGTIRSRMRQRELELELVPYWKNIAPALAIVTGLFLVVGTGVTGVALFGRLQPRIPFYYNAFTGYWEQVDKAILLILPVVFLVAQLIILRFAYEVHRFDPRLSKAVNYILTLHNLLFMLALTQIYILIFPVG